MSIVIGQETEGTGASEIINNERAIAIQFEGLKTETVETMRYHTGSSTNGTAASVRLGLLADLAGAPGAFFGTEAVITGTPVKETTFEAAGGGAIVAGLKYWLAILPVGGTTRVKLTVAGSASAIPETSGKGPTINLLKNWVVAAQGPAFVVGLATAAAPAPRMGMII